MRSLFSLLNVKYEPPISGIPSRPTSISTRVRDGAIRALDRRDGGRVRSEEVVQAAQFGRVVPVHPHPEPDGLLRLARGVGQDALLAQGHELGDAVRLDVALRGEAEVPLDVDLHPQPLAVEAVLVALVLAEHRVEPLVQVLVGPPPGVVDAHRIVRGDRARRGSSTWARRRSGRAAGRRSGVRARCARMSCSWLTRSGLAGTASNIRLQWHRAVGGSRRGTRTGRIRRVRVSYPRCTKRRSRDRAPAPPSPRPSCPCCSRVSGSGMPGRPCGRSPSPPCPILAIALLAGVGLRMDRIALLGLVFDPNHPDRRVRPQPASSSSTGSSPSSTRIGSPSS